MHLHIDAGTLRATEDPAIRRGLLLPYGEVGYSNLGTITVDPGVIELPDLATETPNANLDHDPERDAATIVGLTETPEGIEADFRIWDNAEGRTLLASSNPRRRLSAEVKNLIIDAASRRVTGGRLFGAAFVERAAFPSASLYAAYTPNDTEETSTEEEEDNDMDPEETTTPDTPAPTLKPSGTTPPAKRPGGVLFASAADVAARYAEASQRGDDSLYAALDQATAVDLDAAKTPQWLDEIYAGSTVEDIYADCMLNDSLTGLKGTGWRFKPGKTPQVGNWAGFPAQVPTNEVAVEPVTLTAKRLAGGHEVDRAFHDFSVPSFWTAYNRESADDYKRQIMAKRLEALTAESTAVDAPSVTGTQVPALRYAVRGAMHLLRTVNQLPDYALVGLDLFEELLNTPEDASLAYLEVALGLTGGSLAGRGQFFVPATDPSMDGKVLVGTKGATKFFQLGGGTPIRLDTFTVSKGSVEKGVYGYYASMTQRAAAKALVAPAVAGG